MQIDNGITISSGITIGDEQYSPVAPVTPEWFYKTTIYNASSDVPDPTNGNSFGINISNGYTSWNSDILIGDKITNLTTGLSSVVYDIQYNYTFLQLNQTYATTNAIVRIEDSNALPTGNSQSYKVESPTKQIMLSYGTTNWTVPLDWNNNDNKIQLWGAGGGGGSVTDQSSYATGGGGGAYEVITNLTLTPGQIISITIGQGGIAMSPGGNTIFGSYCSANGGGAGIVGSGINPLNGAVGSYPGGHGGYYIDDENNADTLNGRNGTPYEVLGPDYLDREFGSGGGGAGYHYKTPGIGYNFGGRGGGYYYASGGSNGSVYINNSGKGISIPYAGGGGGAGSVIPGFYTSFGGKGGTPSGGGGAGYDAVPLEGGGQGGDGQIFITYKP